MSVPAYRAAEDGVAVRVGRTLDKEGVVLYGEGQAWCKPDGVRRVVRPGAGRGPGLGQVWRLQRHRAG